MPYRMLGSAVGIHYRTRLEWVLIRLPAYARTALGWAWRSLFRVTPYPDTVVLGSDLEVLAFALMRLARLRPRRPAIVYLGFIYTSRDRAVQETLRRAYYRVVMRCVAMAICHSNLECTRYARLFPGRTRFMFVPWGTNIAIRDQLLALPTGQAIVTAGMAGRDYGSLFAAMDGVEAELRVICGLRAFVPPALPGVRILDRCFGEDYLRELAVARLVVIPLAVSDISAGQMVLIQAMALGRAVIITDTPTVRDYVRDGEDALLVPRADPAALRSAILQVLTDPALCARLGAAARASYEARFSTEAHVAAVLRAIVSRPTPC